MKDGHVYVWQSTSPQAIQVLAGHDFPVNCVAWNPVASRRLFASCSDDGTVRIWQPPEAAEDIEMVEPKDEPVDLPPLPSAAFPALGTNGSDSLSLTAPPDLGRIL